MVIYLKVLNRLSISYTLYIVYIELLFPFSPLRHLVVLFVIKITLPGVEGALSLGPRRGPLARVLEEQSGGAICQGARGRRCVGLGAAHRGRIRLILKVFTSFFASSLRRLYVVFFKFHSSFTSFLQDPAFRSTLVAELASTAAAGPSSERGWGR